MRVGFRVAYLLWSFLLVWGIVTHTTPQIAISVIWLLVLILMKLEERI